MVKNKFPTLTRYGRTPLEDLELANKAYVDSAGGQSNTASNVGSGSGVFKQKVGVDLELRSVIGGTLITATQNTNDITLDTTAEVNPALISQAEAEGGTDTNERLISGQRLKQSIDALGQSMVQNATESSIESFAFALGDVGVTMGSTRQFGKGVQLPALFSYYEITAIEWSNHSTISGNIKGGVSLVPATGVPTEPDVTNIISGQLVAQTPVSSAQKHTFINPALVRGGAIIAGWLFLDNATGQVFADNVGTHDMIKPLLNLENISAVDLEAFTGSAYEPWIKIYFHGIGNAI